jgi:Fibronectin type III domain
MHRKAVVRHAAGAALVLVLALAVAGPVAAGKKPPPTTGDKTPPTTPTNLHVTSLSQTSVTLAWDPSTDNTGRLTYSVNKDGQGFTVPQGQTSFTIDWLSAGRTYTFYVTAVDSSLNTSGKSNILTVTTPPDTAAPPAPTLSGWCSAPRKSGSSGTASKMTRRRSSRTASSPTVPR